MKRQFAVLGLALCLATPSVLSASPGRLRGADCLDPSTARTWTDLGRDTILVDAGRKKYRIHISPACAALNFSPELGFRGDPINGRVCGTIGDSVVTRDYTCRIDGMELLDKDQYKLALEQRKSKTRQKPVSNSKAP